MSRQFRETYDARCDDLFRRMDEWAKAHPGHSDDEAFEAVIRHFETDKEDRHERH